MSKRTAVLLLFQILYSVTVGTPLNVHRYDSFEPKQKVLLMPRYSAQPNRQQLLKMHKERFGMTSSNITDQLYKLNSPRELRSIGESNNERGFPADKAARSRSNRIENIIAEENFPRNGNIKDKSESRYPKSSVRETAEHFKDEIVPNKKLSRLLDKNLLRRQQPNYVMLSKKPIKPLQNAVKKDFKNLESLERAKKSTGFEKILPVTAAKNESNLSRKALEPNFDQKVKPATSAGYEKFPVLELNLLLQSNLRLNQIVPIDESSEKTWQNHIVNNAVSSPTAIPAHTCSADLSLAKNFLTTADKTTSSCKFFKIPKLFKSNDI